MPTQPPTFGNLSRKPLPHPRNMPAKNGTDDFVELVVESIFRVFVPQDVAPGQEFQVNAGNRIVRVRCPPDTQPGKLLQINVPNEHIVTKNGGPPGQFFFYDQTDDIPKYMREISGQSKKGKSAPRPSSVVAVAQLEYYKVTIPVGVEGGQQFRVTINGQMMTVTCPANATPNMKVRILPPKSLDVTRGVYA